MDNKQIKILLVENDFYILGLYSRKFSESGFQVYSACDGLEALRLFEKYRPQVIIMDLNLPEMSGQEVLEIISKDETNHNPICLILSNYDRETVEVEKKLPPIVKDYLLKIETTPDDLVERVKKLLNK